MKNAKEQTHRAGVRPEPAPATQAEPTKQAYGEITKAFQFFNDELFGSTLPHCLITFQRRKRSQGYFSAKRFGAVTGSEVDEIAMNPQHFKIRPLDDVLSTLAHEMCHLWQQYHGKPTRRGYHNAEWAEKMESIGLVPSHTGQPGGRKTGQRMDHYIVPHGPFARAAEKLLATGFRISYYDREVEVRQPEKDEGGSKEIAEPSEDVAADKSNRVKYRCGQCGAQIWGKPGLRVLCGQQGCNAAPFAAVGKEQPDELLDDE